MADPYTGFTSAPLPTRPYGPMTGIAQADADFMQRQAQLRTLEDMFTANDQRKSELQRYQGLTPGMIDEKNYEGALARGKQGIIPQTLQGLIGEAQTKQAAGRVDMETADSKIGVLNDENRNKAVQSQLQFLDSRMPMLEQAVAQDPSGNQAQMVWDKMLQESKAPFPRQFDHNTLPNLEKIRQRLVNTVGQEQELAKTKATGDQQARVTTLQGANQLAVAKSNQEAAKWRSQLSSEEKSRMKKLEEKLVEFAEISQTRDLTDREKATRNEIYQVMQALAIARGAAGPMVGQSFINPNVQAPQPQAYPGGGNPSPQIDIGQMAQQAWGSYEPNKYDYRIDPQTQKLQRKAK